eukprot:Opistho-1_new@790
MDGFFESLIQKLHCNPLSEMQDIGKKAYQELGKVIPSFIRRAEPMHRHYKAFAQFTEQMQMEINQLTERHAQNLDRMQAPGVRLLDYDSHSPSKVAAALLFGSSSCGLLELQEYCRKLSDEELGRILEAGANYRENRRHKSPRALELAVFTFEIVADFGVYRDLHRHRILTQEKQLLTCNLGYFVPVEIQGTDMERPYRLALEEAKEAYDRIAVELPEEAQYIVPMYSALI